MKCYFYNIPIRLFVIVWYTFENSNIDGAVITTHFFTLFCALLDTAYDLIAILVIYILKLVTICLPSSLSLVKKIKLFYKAASLNFQQIIIKNVRVHHPEYGEIVDVLRDDLPSIDATRVHLWLCRFAQ